MRELEQFLNVEAEWVLERLSTGTESNDRNYYQGRLDQLAQVRRFLGQAQIMRERVSNAKECGCNAGTMTNRKEVKVETLQERADRTNPYLLKTERNN
jgi:hypothetical protein